MTNQTNRKNEAKEQISMIKKYHGFLTSLLLIMIMTLTACTPAQTNTIAYQTISAAEAKKMMDEEKEVIILDVRTLEEYNAGHIEGAVLLPVTDIEKEAANVLPDKDATILVYCRSGNRSQTASQKLVDLGYTKVFDFGGIINWPYNVVTE